MIHTIESLIELQDYINMLDDKIGLKPETMQDIYSAISKEKKILNGVAVSEEKSCHMVNRSCLCKLKIKCSECDLFY